MTSQQHSRRKKIDECSALGLLHTPWKSKARIGGGEERDDTCDPMACAQKKLECVKCERNREEKKSQRARAAHQT